jgi:hypothetical protein
MVWLVISLKDALENYSFEMKYDKFRTFRVEGQKTYLANMLKRFNILLFQNRKSNRENRK